MATPDQTHRLEALSALLASGQTASEALATLQRVGGAVGTWARTIAGLAQSGGLGSALAQQRALHRDELTRIGGAHAAGSAGALAWVVHRRQTLRARGRTFWAALALPAVFTLATVGGARLLALLLGAPGSLLLDLSPLLLVVAGIVVATLPNVARTRSRLAGLPWVMTLRRGDAEAELAVVLATSPDAEGFDGVASLVPEHRVAALTAARALRGGAPLGEALPTAPEVGEELALRLATAFNGDHLRVALRQHAEDLRDEVTRRAARVVRIAAYAALLFATARSVQTLTQVDLGGVGAGPPLLDDALRDRLAPGGLNDLEELLKEIDP